MSGNPLDSIPSFDRVSIRAVVVNDGEDLAKALSEAGIVDPIALPIVFGEGQPDIGFGDGITPNLIAVLELDQEEGDYGSSPPTHNFLPGAHASLPGGQPGTAGPAFDDARPSGPVTTNLPAAFGMQPLA